MSENGEREKEKKLAEGDPSEEMKNNQKNQKIKKR